MDQVATQSGDPLSKENFDSYASILKPTYLSKLSQRPIEASSGKRPIEASSGESRGQSRPRSAPLPALYSPVDHWEMDKGIKAILENIKKAESDMKDSYLAAISLDAASKNKILKDLLMRELVERKYIAHKKVYARGLELNAYKILNENIVGELFKIFFFKNLKEYERLALQNKDFKLFWNLYFERMYRKWAGAAGMMVFNNPDFYSLVGGGRITELFCWDKTKGRPFHYVLPLPQFIKNGVILLDLQNFGAGMSVQNPAVNVHTESFINFQERVLNPLLIEQRYFS